MLISVWRHGEAGPGSPDRDRRLTARGEAQVERGARDFVVRLQRRSLSLPGRILFSRWRRTAQTADRIREWCAGAEPETLDALIPDRDAALVDDAVTRFEDRESHLVLVSHQPLVTALIDRWLGTSGEVPPLVPGAYVVLDVPVVASGCAAVVWWASPPDYEV